MTRSVLAVKRGAVALLALAVSPVVASAIEVPAAYSTSIVNRKTDFQDNQTLSFAKFNSALGALQQVKISFDSQITTTASVQNTDAAAQAIYLQTKFYLAVQDQANRFTQADHLPGNLAVIPTLSQIRVTTPELMAGGKILASGEHVDQQYSGEFSSPTYVYSDLAILTDFTGSGAYSLQVFAKALSVITASGNSIVNQSTDATVTANVTYVYSSVPEATTLLLGFAAGCPIIMHRRRRVA